AGEARAPALGSGVVAQDRAGDERAVCVAAVVDRAAAAAAWCPARGGVRAPANGRIIDENAVENVPLDADAAQRSAVGTTAATERVTGDIHRPVLVLGEHPDGAATEIWAIAVAPVADDPGLARLELAALDVDGATAVDAAVPALRGVGRAGRLVRAVEAVGERDVLHDDLRIRLVDAVAGRPLARAR